MKKIAQKTNQENFVDLGDKRLPRDMIADKIEEEQQRKQQVETAIADQEEKLPVFPPPLATFRAELSEGMAEPALCPCAIPTSLWWHKLKPKPKSFPRNETCFLFDSP